MTRRDTCPPIPSQDDDLHKIFDNIDRTHSGLIDYTEFIAACLWSSKTLVSVPCAVCDPAMMIHLPYTAGAHPPSLYGRRPSTFLIWQVTAFRLIDKHGHGYITKKDLYEAFTPEFSKAEIDQMVRSDEIG